VFVRTDFDSVDEAQAFRKRLLESDVLDKLEIVKEPTVVELADEAKY
jgi:hypothetical protein